MKIAHLCLSCFYVDGYAYQENQLVAEHVRTGHDVHVLASTDSFDKHGLPTSVSPGTYMGTDGAQVTRLQYRFSNLPMLARKLRLYVGLSERLQRLAPDVIVFHGLCAGALLTVARYARKNPDVVLYADSHEDHHNSGRTWLSRWGLHYSYYRPIIRSALPQISSVLCVSVETMNYVEERYGIGPAQLEYFPLGGTVLSDDEYLTTRAGVRCEFGWTSDNRVFLQSGKIDAIKRLDWTIDAFAQIPDPHARLVIAGQLLPDVREELEPLIARDERILPLGWVTPKRLQELLCAADVYLQPGSQSATMQMALCCRKPVILDDVPSHRKLVSNNGMLIQGRRQLATMVSKMHEISDAELQLMSDGSREVASLYLDYKQQAKRLLLAD